MTRRGLVPFVFVLVTGASSHAQCPTTRLFGDAELLGFAAKIVRVADVNGDGTLDLVSSNGPVVLGDFNGDAILDIATFSEVAVRLGIPLQPGSDTIAFTTATTYMGLGPVSILLGNGTAGVGDGTFAVATRFNAGDNASGALGVGDFNEDGILDLVTGIGPYCVSYPNDCPSGIAVMLGNGTAGVGEGTFASPVNYTAHTNPNYAQTISDILVDDVDADGILDVLLSIASQDGGGGVRRFMGNGSSGIGDGTFASPLLWFFSSAIQVAMGQVDQNPLREILLLGNQVSACGGFSGYAQVSILTSGGVSLNTVPVNDCSAPALATGLALVDLDHDANLDFVVANGSRATAFLGNGFGAFSLPDHYSLRNPATGFLTVADFNSDGMQDLVVAAGNTMLLRGGCPDPETSAPRITAVDDVPNDQGGRLFVKWDRSPIDARGVRIVTGYIVWRRIPLSVALTEDSRPRSRVVTRSDPDGDTTYWEPLATLPAHALQGYGYTATTTQDSMPGSNPYTAFFVSAITEDPFIFYESVADSGYSVDNLSPTLPKGVRGFLIPESGDLVLHWRPNPEPDLHHYNVYRGYSPGFDPLPATLIASPTDTMYVDPDFGVSTFYRVSAVDIHGNESRPPVPVSAGEVPLGTPHLYPAFVPPGSAPVEIRYVLGPRTASMRLELFDVAGGRVRMLDSGTRAPGEYRQLWNRRNDSGAVVAQGIYVARLTAGGQRLTQKIVLLRQ